MSEKQTTAPAREEAQTDMVPRSRLKAVEAELAQAERELAHFRGLIRPLATELEHAARWFDQLKPEDAKRYRAALNAAMQHAAPPAEPPAVEVDAKVHGRLMSLADTYAMARSQADGEGFTKQSDIDEAEHESTKARDKLNMALRAALRAQSAAVEAAPMVKE